MENFKKKLQRRFYLCLMLCCSGSAVYWGLSYLIKDVPDFSRGMIAGVYFGIIVVAAFLMIKYLILLRNEDKLKAEYIKTTDERNIEISKATMRTSSVISLVATGLAVLITGFFSKTVSITLFIDMTAGALITVLVNLYYNKKM
ncbi:hypothetical protein SAMN02910265_00734 [Ruminococcus flavefaciens]|uniref:DUF2178 domain-containing protein n=1 Tax=Ruminococcus flavefaciens TaxID=1265 RepID=A0A1H6I9Z3_RUMFL|nr:hypothetical protein [Ruminococcus flavefaciens]SEH45537.1 hypothetical protein SAMN02910265_00734 [Ruminococcus flavefaciens]